MEALLEPLLVPFSYAYMARAIWVCALVGGVCAFLSAYLMLKGWSLMGDALSHAIVPGVAGAWLLGLPFSLGAFAAGGLAAATMLFLRQKTRLREDVIIGVIFTSFFGLGLFMVSLSPIPINVQTIIMGNVLTISEDDTRQLLVIAGVSLALLLWKWRDLLAVFFDEQHAHAIGIKPLRLKALFFALLSAATVAAMMTVGAFLVIAMVVTPGATAYLLSDRFARVLAISVAIGAGTGMVGAWASYFIDGATGGVIVLLQTAVFLIAFVFAPKHGRLAARQRGYVHTRRVHDEGAS